MLTRRLFLQQASLASIALASGASAQPGTQPGTQPIGVQLYTVRQQLAAEGALNGVLARLRAIGYEEVEPFGGMYRTPARELRRMLDDNGLRAPSGHFDYDTFETWMDYAAEIGCQSMVCPALPGPIRDGGEAGFLQTAQRFNHLGQLLKTRGMKFAYHNHNFEFRPLDGGKTIGYDVLLNHTDPALVGFEMDCYWVAQAGRDPLEMLRRNKGRIQLLHVKDRKAGFPASQEMNATAGHFAEVGQGTIAWAPILHLAREQGIRHFFVEQDQTDRPPLDALKISFDYLHKAFA